MAQQLMSYRVDYRTDPPRIVNWRPPQKSRDGGELAWLRRDHELDHGRGAPAGGWHASVRTFHISVDEQAPPARVRTERQLGRGGGAVYLVDDGYGAPLGRITYRRRPFARSEWVVEPAVGPAIRGRKGRLFWWAVWWPWGLMLSWVSAIMAIFAEGDGGFGPPRRVTWRDASGRVHLLFRGIADEYEVREEGWDPRLVSALVGLHQSFDPSEGAPADGWYGT
ncbi:hypothetical protein GCM10010252_71570 [Streptomyces aureoverticillatus]|nr:hypothetical protein GCM10010252_71570 [Streptomyces aureoverticillatus]